jgi:hypothetical protein
MGLLDFAKSISRNFEIIVSEYKSREWRFGNFVNILSRVSEYTFRSLSHNRFHAFHD